MGGLAREFDAAPPSRAWSGVARRRGRLGHAHSTRASGTRRRRVQLPGLHGGEGGAAEQGAEAADGCLRALREGLICFRRKLDHLRGARRGGARGRAGRGALPRSTSASHAIVEAFGADLDDRPRRAGGGRDAGEVQCSRVTGEERVPFPTLRFDGRRGALELRVRLTAGASATRRGRWARSPPPASGRTRAAALRRFGRMAAAEVAAVCDLPAPARGARAVAGLVAEGQSRALPVLAGRLYEAERVVGGL